MRFLRRLCSRQEADKSKLGEYEERYMNILIIIILAAVAAWAIWRTVQRQKKGSACCGEHEETVKKINVTDRNKGNYPYTATLQIGGMTCDNCARRVENALNSLEGTWAIVSISDHKAKVLSKTKPDETAMRAAVRGAGYVVTGYEQG